MNSEDFFKFKVGDIVVHVSGGPTLAVLNVSHHYDSTPQNPLVLVSCQWWDNPTNSFKKEVFKQELLKAV